MKRRFYLGTIFAVFLMAACNKSNTTGGAHATVTLRDGTLVSGVVVSTSSSEIKLTVDDQSSRTIPMAQVKSIEYDQPAPVSTDTLNQQPAAGSQATQPNGTSSQPTQQAAASPREAHEHPAESAITTKTYILPIGTQVSVRTEETIDSAKAAEGQTFAAEVTQSVRDESGAVVIPRGANAKIIITSASAGDRFRKASDLSLDLKSVAIEGREYRLSTVDVAQKGKAGLGANKRTAEYSGGGAALGAIIGAIAGGGKGAGIGAGAGAGAGAITQIVTKGKAVKVPVESVLTFQLDKPLKVVRAQ